MPQITCPVCGYSYATSNITNHVRKAHSGVVVSQEAAAAVGLAACSCGQVVLHAAALRKHQGIRKCQGAASQPAAVPALAIATPAPSMSQNVHTESASATSAQPQDSSLNDVLDPAILAEEQAMPVEPSDTEYEPLALADDNLDFVFAEAEAETVQEPGTNVEDVEMQDNFHQDASSPEVPALEPNPNLDSPVTELDTEPQDLDAAEENTLPQVPEEPQHEQAQAAAPERQPLELDAAEMPTDGIVVLLPGTNSTEEALPAPEMLLNAMEARPRLPPIPPLNPITDWSGPVHHDVDSFAVTIFPAVLLHIFPAGCYALLVSRAPEFKDLPLFKDWVYFAELKVALRFEPRFKLPLVERLQQPPQNAILLPSGHPVALTYGELRVEISILVDALHDIGCESVRMGTYGVKVPMDRFLDPAILSEHPMQATNVFDIGCTVDTGRISLLAPKSRRGKYKPYPSALRVGHGYGSVELRWKHRPDGIMHFKGYSKLTHLLKAGAAGAGQAGQPMIIKTVQVRIATLKNWKERIAVAGPDVGQGVRLEVTVQAATMQAAREVAEASRFLDPQYLFSPAAGDQQLIGHAISKADMFADLDALLALANEKQIFRGSNNAASTQLQRQVVIDLYNAMGWHPGRRPTALNSATVSAVGRLTRSVRC